jgi:serine/threonine protein kinase/predicted Zn-dependent protease
MIGADELAGANGIGFPLAGTTPPPSQCKVCGATSEGGYTCLACRQRLIDIALSPDSDESISVGAARLADSSQAVSWQYEHYEVLRHPDGSLWELGRGAMGVTYKAIDTNLRRVAALKIISARFLASAPARERFLLEARTAAGLRHPHIASVFHLGLRDGACFYAMEYIEGETLGSFVKRTGPVPWAVALRVVMQVADALVAAHGQRFIHRDIKPTNIMLVSDEHQASNAVTVKVIDFGLVKPMSAAASGEASEHVREYFAGTPRYASPEQLEFGVADARSDLYSLGVTLWHMLAGGLPAMPLRAMADTRSLPKELFLAELPADVPPSVVSLLRAMLQEDPALRPQTAAELLEACRKCIEAPALPPRQSERPRGRFRSWHLPWALILLMACASGIWIWKSSMNPPYSREKSIAVLPFISLGGTPQDQVLGAALAEDMVAHLSKVSDLSVASLNSALAYNASGASASGMGRRLGVAWLLTGSIRRTGDHLKVNCQLVDAATNRSWGEAFGYEGRMEDIFLFESQLSHKIVKALQVKLPSKERSSLDMKPTERMDAYMAYAQGRQHARNLTREGNARAIDFYSQALAEDPRYTLAHAALAEALCQGVRRSWHSAGQIDLALASARKAIALEPDAPEGHAVLGMVYATQGMPWKALAEVRRALEIRPHHLPAMRDFGVFWMMVGQPHKGAPWLEAAARLDPSNIDVWCSLAETYKDMCVDEKAQKYFEQSLAMDPARMPAWYGLVHLRLLQESFDHARRDCAAALALRPDSAYGLMLSAQLDLFQGNYSKAEATYQRLLKINRTGNVTYFGSIRYLSALGFLSQRRGDVAQAESFLNEAAALDERSLNDGPGSIYDLAAIRATQGRAQEAISLLEQSIAAGWIDFRSTLLDPRFTALSGDPAFQTAMGNLRTAVAGMRAKANALTSRPLDIADYPVTPP